MQKAEYWIEKLELQKHSEGGWFKEIYRSEDLIQEESLHENFQGERNCSTSIYYLLEGNDFSSFHRIKSDEIWHFYTGTSTVEIYWIDNGLLQKIKLGPGFENGEHFQVVASKNKWFAARLINSKGYALVGCTVSPGFNFEDFELAGTSLLEEYPHLKEDIKELIRK